MLQFALPIPSLAAPSEPSTAALHRVLEALEGVAEAAVDGHPQMVPAACRKAQTAWKGDRTVLSSVFEPETLVRLDQDVAQLSTAAPSAAALRSIDLSRRLAEHLPLGRKRALLTADLACMEASIRMASGAISMDLRAAFAPLRENDTAHRAAWAKIDRALQAFDDRVHHPEEGRSAVKQLLDLVDALEK